MPDDEKTKVVPLEVERVEIMGGYWNEALAALRTLGDPDVPPTTWRRDEHELATVLRQWGWTSSAYQSTNWTDPTRRFEIVGIYGDWTWLEDDERLWPVLAPFIPSGARIIFQPEDEARYSTDHGIEGWYFDGRTAERRSVERVIEYEWA